MRDPAEGLPARKYLVEAIRPAIIGRPYALSVRSFQSCLRRRDQALVYVGPQPPEVELLLVSEPTPIATG